MGGLVARRAAGRLGTRLRGLLLADILRYLANGARYLASGGECREFWS
jgi:hypothetical protein